jgi:hypothetical protein
MASTAVVGIAARNKEAWTRDRSGGPERVGACGWWQGGRNSQEVKVTRGVVGSTGASGDGGVCRRVGMNSSCACVRVEGAPSDRWLRVSEQQVVLHVWQTPRGHVSLFFCGKTHLDLNQNTWLPRTN